jgi:hypothetical protein
MADSEPKFVEIYRARNLAQAHALRIVLEEAGVRVQIEGELLQGAVGELPLGWVTAPRILVRQSQVATAREIVGRLDIPQNAGADDEDQQEVTRCLACGRTLAEGEPKCPSCGWSYQGV